MEEFPVAGVKYMKPTDSINKYTETYLPSDLDPTNKALYSYTWHTVCHMTNMNIVTNVC